MRRVIIGLAIVMLMGFSGVVLAQSMSELNLKGFDKESKTQETSGSSKSPFSQARISPKDMNPEDLYLSGVAIGSGKRYALISGHVLQEGDSVAGLRVKSINLNRVVLQHLDKVHTLNLEGGY